MKKTHLWSALSNGALAFVTATFHAVRVYARVTEKPHCKTATWMATLRPSRRLDQPSGRNTTIWLRLKGSDYNHISDSEALDFLCTGVLRGCLASLALGLVSLTSNAANLTGISLAPTNPTATVGAVIQFSATGSYDDGSVRMLTTQTLSSGGDHTCSILNSGEVQCWGYNSGYPNNNSRIAGITTAIAVAAGFGHNCVILADATVKCWGANSYGQLGNGFTANSPNPVVVTGISTATAIAAGYYHSCALLADGTVECWGQNSNGQLGDGTYTNAHTPVAVAGISTAIAITAGDTHTCAVLADGSVKCWGDNNTGQLGNGTFTASPTPVAVTGISTAIAIDADQSFTCAVLADGSMRCWGSNFSGQLGDGSHNYSTTPVVVSGMTTATAVAVGSDHSCALLADGTMQCWGLSGTGNATGSSTPLAVSGISTATAIAAGNSHSCALLADGNVECWGRYGASNIIGLAEEDQPMQVFSLGEATATADSGFLHTCVVITDGSVQCWGTNWDGELGQDDIFSTQPWPPVTVNGITTATAAATGDNFSCALLSSGSVQCWGTNNYGQLGDGSTTTSVIPVSVSGISTATAITAGGYHGCALLADGTVECWGENGLGELGDGTYTDAHTPVAVAGISTAIAIAAGSSHTCALLADHSMRCWGENIQGELGDGSSVSASNTPVVVSGITTATAITAGSAGGCAVLADGSARCWGYNYYGLLGDGSHNNYSNTPVVVSGITTATAIAMGGDDHTCALLADGGVKCWGTNDTGQLGNGTNTNSYTPVSVSPLRAAAIAITAGSNSFSCAIFADGEAQCWGYNGDGALGNGKTDQSNKPVTVISLKGASGLSWTSSDPTVATIDTNGLARAVGNGITTITASYGGFVASTFLNVGNIPDSDGDGVPDNIDNCTQVANTDQSDTDGDGYGNLCDADLDNSGGVVNFADLALFKAAFGKSDPDADFDGSGGVVNFADLAIFKRLFGKAPGPSCCGTLSP